MAKIEVAPENWVGRLWTDNPDDWLERVYAIAASWRIPWDDGQAHPMLLDWLKRNPLDTSRKVLDAGCGLGYNAEAFAAHGFKVTAFDVSSSAVETCRFYSAGHSAVGAARRKSVSYQQADLLAPPVRWRRRFDVVFEAALLQVLADPKETMQRALHNLCGFVKPGGTLMTICRLRTRTTPQNRRPPWHFELAELRRITADEGFVLQEHVTRKTAGVTRALLSFSRSSS
ncbi:MAG TPA: class I SAM-dependent methyltransferase [Candidatus Krumholzibacteria bacterium]